MDQKTKFKPLSPLNSRDLQSLATEVYTIDSHVITKEQIQNVPRKRSRSQTQTMGGQSAATAIQSFLKSQDPTLAAELEKIIPDCQMHWCHILAFCLVAGAWDPQRPDNLVSGSAPFNWSQKHYEVALRNLLLTGQYEAIRIVGEAVCFLGQRMVVKSINLNVELYTAKGNKITFALPFEAFVSHTESHMGASVLQQVLGLFTERTPSSLFRKLDFEDSEELLSSPTP